MKPFLLTLMAVCAAAQTPLVLDTGWSVQSSREVKATGAELSSPGFATNAWHKTAVPSTVVAALVADTTYPDPYFGTNLRDYPGMDYPIGRLFSNIDMPANSPYRVSWWYRTEFTVPAEAGGHSAWLQFDGINYRANIWLNGRQIANSKDVAGAFRAYEFDVTGLVEPGKANALAVEVFAPEKTALAINWVDWNPAPPDKDMGLWKPVHLKFSGPVAVRDPFVKTKLAADYKSAELTLIADVRNATGQPVSGVLKAEIAGVRVSRPVELRAAEKKTVRLAPRRIENPRLWWPFQMGAQELYTAHVEFETGGRVSDRARFDFGIREVTSELTPKGALLFKINGKNVLLRGAAWTPDMLLRWERSRVEAELRYVKDMGLNTIRLEGKSERPEFYEMADRMGLLIMTGWCCCDMWERWPKWQPEHHKIAAASLDTQIRYLRNHPSVFVWLNGSDGPPPADVEKMYLGILKDLDWPNPSISSAAADATSVTGPSGVKMTGPYDYEPPNYWLVDKEAGGAWGLNTETSPGPAIPTLESLKRFIPADHLWPIDKVWNYHAGGERFMNMELFNKAMDKRYGKPADLADYLRKAQAMAYEGQRAMFEAYSRNKYTSTGVIQWMLNNAWPSLIWHLYDYYLIPAGGYFGTKKACEPLHVQYGYDDHSVGVVNSTYEPHKGLRVSAKIYNLDLTEKYSNEAPLDIEADGTRKAFDLPKIEGLDTTYFLRLELRDAEGNLKSDNFYWLSTKPDTLDWKGRKDTAFTPQAEYGDLQALNNLPPVKLKLKTERTRGAVGVTIENPDKAVAFLVHARLTRAGEDLAPVYWSDNYITLFPGEKRELTATYQGEGAEVAIDGWNVF
ncbi:MAG: glycoside hydrolase family 2 protein [Acidobacteriota bacterium]